MIRRRLPLTYELPPPLFSLLPLFLVRGRERESRRCKLKEPTHSEKKYYLSVYHTYTHTHRRCMATVRNENGIRRKEEKTANLIRRVRKVEEIKENKRVYKREERERERSNSVPYRNIKKVCSIQKGLLKIIGTCKHFKFIQS